MPLKTTIAAPFRHTRKTAMRKNELVYYFALDRKWMSTEQANLLLKNAEEEGLLVQDKGVFSPGFDISAVTIPVGFKPTSVIFEKKDPSQDLIRRIAQATKKEETEVVAEMNLLIKDGFDGNLLPEAALAIIAKRHNVPFEDKLEALQQSLKKK
ncbi:MAG: DUF2240 family protein [Methanoregula sp.]|nr:MAG: DUF2240 family protein [Methanoregula sp.]